MKRIYLVRHGETDGNTGPLRQNPETPLNEMGLKQAQMIAERCMELKFEKIISSNMLRTKQTAEAIKAKTGIDIEFTDLFRERAAATEIWDQPKDSELVRNYERSLRENYHKPGYRYSDEESFEELRSRALKALNFLEYQTSNNIVVVSHGTFSRTLLAVVIIGPDISGLEWVKFMKAVRMQNTGMSVLEFSKLDDTSEKSNWRLCTWNDQAHLG